VCVKEGETAREKEEKWLLAFVCKSMCGDGFVCFKGGDKLAG